MMTRTLLSLAVLGLLVPGAASAQSGWWDPVVDRLPAQEGERPDVCRVRPDLPVCDTRRSRTDDGDWERQTDGRVGTIGSSRSRRGNGPPFCRNGAGHPTKGRAWCREKGWDGAWYDTGWDDVIFGRYPSRRGTVDRGGLIDVLGGVILGRLEGRAGLRSGAPLEGRFLDGRRILQIRVGGTPVAELLDANADGRVDRTVLVRRR
jgi:hypothetical protein